MQTDSVAILIRESKDRSEDSDGDTQQLIGKKTFIFILTDSCMIVATYLNMSLYEYERVVYKL